MTEKLLIVLGDSLPFPRHDLPQDSSDTWPQLLVRDQTFDTVWFQAQPGGLVYDAVQRLESLIPYIPKRSATTVIISQGIVDSTPRPYPRLLIRPVVKLEAAIDRAIGVKLRLKRRRVLYKLYGKPWTRPESFKRCVERISRLTEGIGGAKIIWLKVLEPGNYMTDIVGNFEVNPYNQILKVQAQRSGNFFYLDLKLSAMHTDGHHLTSPNHCEVAEQIRELMGV